MDERDRESRQESSVTTEPKQNEAEHPVRTYPGFPREVASVLLKAVVVFLVFILMIGTIGAVYQEQFALSDGSCNVAVFPFDGIILPYNILTFEELTVTPNTVRNFIRQAENDPSIAAILLEINSPGGTPVASEQIAELVEMTDLPVAGLIGDIGTSGGYLVAASTDHLIASAMSDIGSLAVTMSYLEQTQQNEEEGLEFVELSSGEFKDAGNPNRSLTEKERALFERDLEIIHDVFTAQIAAYRSLPVEDIRALADGSSMTGKQALEVGLIDELGGRSEARSYLAESLFMDSEDISFCEYQRSPLPL